MKSKKTQQFLGKKSGRRRNGARYKLHLAITVFCVGKNLENSKIEVLSKEFDSESLVLNNQLPSDIYPKSIECEVEGKKYYLEITSVISRKEAGNTILKFIREEFSNLYSVLLSNPSVVQSHDRRDHESNTTKKYSEGLDAEIVSRRLIDLYNDQIDESEIVEEKAQILFRKKSLAYDKALVEERRSWIENKVNADLSPLENFNEDPKVFQGNIENLIGVVGVPVGVAGPLRINGGHAKGDFFIPLATTEGVLVNSYTLGMSLITRSGGANVRLLDDQMRISPSFVFSGIHESIAFSKWIIANKQKIKELVENTTKHGRLLKVQPKVLGRQVVVLFSYDTGDAMGLNMICRATEAACAWIVNVAKPKNYFLRSNFSSNKKVSAYNMQHTYGKSLVAEVTIPKQLLGVVKITPKLMSEYSYSRLVSGIHSGMIGNNGHFANGLAAMFIACGQDVAHVANSHVGVSSCEVTENGDLYVSAYLPNLLVGTVGGGTALPSSRACLEMIGCYGSGKAKKFAEIVVATLLAGEISICAAINNGTYVQAHELFGRNRPA